MHCPHGHDETGCPLCHTAGMMRPRLHINPLPRRPLQTNVPLEHELRTRTPLPTDDLLDPMVLPTQPKPLPHGAGALGVPDPEPPAMVTQRLDGLEPKLPYDEEFKAMGALADPRLRFSDLS